MMKQFNFLFFLFLITILLTLTGCSSWDKDYRESAKEYYAAQLTIAEESKAILYFPGGAPAGAYIEIPTVANVNVQAPKHKLEVIEPIITTGLNGGLILAGESIRADTARHLSDNNLRSNEINTNAQVLNNQQNNATSQAAINALTSQNEALLESLTATEATQ